MNANTDLTDIFLQPGDCSVAGAGCQIRTMLGSCVSITLWHPATRIGAMSHCLLPSRGAVLSPGALDGRYADEAMQLMLDQLKQFGVSTSQCLGKVFGGGNMFRGPTAAANMNVGLRNGEAARALLKRNGIPLVSESLFGFGHRQIVFDVGSGDVWSHQVVPAEPVALAKGGSAWHLSK